MPKKDIKQSHSKPPKIFWMSDRFIMHSPSRFFRFLNISFLDSQTVMKRYIPCLEAISLIRLLWLSFSLQREEDWHVIARHSWYSLNRDMVFQILYLLQFCKMVLQYLIIWYSCVVAKMSKRVDWIKSKQHDAIMLRWNRIDGCTIWVQWETGKKQWIRYL